MPSGQQSDLMKALEGSSRALDSLGPREALAERPTPLPSPKPTPDDLEEAPGGLQRNLPSLGGLLLSAHPHLSCAGRERDIACDFGVAGWKGRGPLKSLEKRSDGNSLVVSDTLPPQELKVIKDGGSNAGERLSVGYFAGDAFRVSSIERMFVSESEIESGLFGSFRLENGADPGDLLFLPPAFKDTARPPERMKLSTPPEQVRQKYSGLFSRKLELLLGAGRDCFSEKFVAAFFGPGSLKPYDAAFRNSKRVLWRYDPGSQIVMASSHGDESGDSSRGIPIQMPKQIWSGASRQRYKGAFLVGRGPFRMGPLSVFQPMTEAGPPCL